MLPRPLLSVRTPGFLCPTSNKAIFASSRALRCPWLLMTSTSLPSADRLPLPRSHRLSFEADDELAFAWIGVEELGRRKRSRLTNSVGASRRRCGGCPRSIIGPLEIPPSGNLGPSVLLLRLNVSAIPLLCHVHYELVLANCAESLFAQPKHASNEPRWSSTQTPTHVQIDVEQSGKLWLRHCDIRLCGKPPDT